MYLRKYSDWSFGIYVHRNTYCGGQYTEYEFRVDFWKWSIGVVW